VNDFHRRLDGLVVSRHFVSPAPVVGNDVRNVQHMAVARRMIIFFMFLSFFFLGLVFVNWPAGRRWERADVLDAFLGSDVDKLVEWRRVHGKFFPSIGRLLMKMRVVTRQSASVCN